MTDAGNKMPTIREPKAAPVVGLNCWVIILPAVASLLTSRGSTNSVWLVVEAGHHMTFTSCRLTSMNVNVVHDCHVTMHLVKSSHLSKRGCNNINVKCLVFYVNVPFQVA